MLMTGNLRKDWEVLHKLETGAVDEDGEFEWLIKKLKEGIRNLYRARAKRDAEEVYHWKSFRDDWDRRYCRIEYEGIPTEEEIK